MKHFLIKLIATVLFAATIYISALGAMAIDWNDHSPMQLLYRLISIVPFTIVVCSLVGLARIHDKEVANKYKRD